MHKYLLIAIWASSSLACSVSPGWVPPTTDEQVSLSGAVLKGRVLKVTGNQFIGFTVVVVGATYFKGCGPTTVKITGYRGSSLCTPDPPAVGATIFAFVCKGTASDWALNNFDVSTGSLNHTPELENQITLLTDDELKCSNCCFLYKTCKKRQPKIVPPVIIAFPLSGSA